MLEKSSTAKIKMKRLRRQEVLFWSTIYFTGISPGMSFTGFIIILNGPDTWVNKICEIFNRTGWGICNSLLLILLVGEVYWHLFAIKETIHQCSSKSKYLKISFTLTYHFYLFLLVFSRSHRCRKYKNNRLICAAVDWLMYEQCWQCPDHHDSVAEVPSISLKSSSSYKVEWEIHKDDKDETKI